ncbi:twitching motility protein PilT [Bdellovibrio sp. HCB2-146]|uniref:twitching motility protein PilT n=1 Tax=Bdellovibrio sp. HCB2-146 TaxID=3394362 RepID=UPI0039BC6870
MSLTELLLQAKAKKADEFLFVVGAEPRARLANGWVTLRSTPGLVTEWNLLQQSLLSNQQKAVLDTTGVVLGETALDSHRVGFSFFQEGATMKAVVDLDVDGLKQEVSLPASLLENALRMKGMMLLSGPGEGGRSWILQKLLQKMSEEKSFSAAVLSARTFPQIRDEKACFVYHNGQFARSEDRESLLAGLDLVVYDGFSDEKFLEALNLAEQGTFVIYSMKSPSMENTLRRCFSVLHKNFGAQGSPRWAEVLSVVAGSYGMPGLSGERVFAHEILLVKPQVRSLLENEDCKGVLQALGQAAENSGLLALNQSLLQHLIRRRIDLKTAFEVSRDPDNLDQLLKKVGI